MSKSGGALLIAEFELEEAREEIVRLRAALAVHGDENNWRGEQPRVWVGDSYLTPWAIAQEVLIPQAKAEVAG